MASNPSLQCSAMFLYIDPLKQGLKHIPAISGSYVCIVFLYIDPLKQGLKLFSLNSHESSECSFYT